MSLTRKLMTLSFLLVSALSIGCGGGDPPVADAPAQPEPELTPEEEAAEEEYIKSQQQ